MALARSQPGDDRDDLFDESFLKKLEYLYLVSKKIFAGGARADRRTKKTGSGVEFADHRNYARGDDFRYIDWNIYGRMDKLLLRLFEEEEDLSIYILVDCSRSMLIGEPPKLHYAMKLAAALSYVGLSNLDRVSIVPFADKLHERLQPARGKGQIFKVFDFLRKVPAGGPTNLGPAVTKFVHQTKRRGLAVLLSDFYDPAGYEEGINVLRYHRFEPFVVQVYDEKEADPPLRGDLTLVDCETGEPKEVTISAKLLDEYRKEHERYCQELETYCTTRSVPFFRTHTGVPFDELVLRIFRAGGFLKLIWGSILSVGTVGTVAAIVGALVVGAYILKLRRRRFEVPFSKLWQRVLREKETTSLWRKLKRLLSLAVQLAFVALLLGAALDPRIGEAKSAARNVVLIIDASASMKALDRGPQEPSRIERAKDEAREVLRSLGAGDAAMLVQMDGQATALSRFESDKANLFARVDAIRASDTPADLRRALQAGADALRGRKNPMIVIFGDGGYADDARAAVAWDQAPTELGVVDLRGIDVRYRRVDGGASDGKAARNVGITAFNVRRYLANKLSYEVLVEAQNFGPEPESVKLTLYSGDEAVDVKTLELRAGERRREIYPDLGGGDDRALRAELTPAKGPDVLPLDDVAYALLPERKKQKVLLVSTDNLYLEGALLLDPNVTIDKVLPAEYPALAAKAPDYDVVVYDGFTPDGTPPARAAIYFDPTPARSPIAVRSELARPLLTDVAPDHPVTRWVTLGDVNIDRSSVFAPATGDVVLARSVREPVVVAGVRDGRKLVVFGFNLAGTDLTLRVAFPILLVNALDWFAGDDAELMTTYRTGQVWSIPVESSSPTFASVSIAGPTGSWKAPVQNGRARFYGAAAGIYQVNADGDKIALAANLANPAESNLATVPSLVLGGKTLAEPPTFAPSVSRHIWVYLILGALVLSTIEWLTYNRRITV